MAVYRSTASPISVAGALLLVVWLLAPFLQPRPIIFSFVLLSMLVVVLQNRDRVLWLVVPIMWVWASVHGSWVIGGLLLVLEAARTADRRILKAGVVAAAATVATPHGIGAWLVVLDFFGAREALAQIAEWQVPDFGSPAQMPYGLLIVGIIVASIRGRLTMRDLIVVVPFLFLGLTTRRTVVPVTIILAPWAALALPSWTVPRSTSRALIVWVAMALVAVVGLMPMLAVSGKLDPERFPGDDVVARLEGTNPFHDAGIGGYLIYVQWPDRLVWMDDRAELHGAERFAELRGAVDGEYEEVFERYGFDAALTKPEWPLTDRLLVDGWNLDYQSTDFLVLVP